MSEWVRWSHGGCRMGDEAEVGGELERMAEL